MNKLMKSMIACLLLILTCGCNHNTEQLVDIQEVSAWCILGFDSLDRNPAQRMEMLKELGLKKYGYNRGKAEYDKLKVEFDLAKENDIEITSAFLWLNASKDSLHQLSAENETLLAQLKLVDQKPAIWVSFNNNFFENLDDEKALDVAVNMITYIKSRTDTLGCELALYNHKGWFGSPMNQIKIINELDQSGITMVYNFHHAHEDLGNFKENLKLVRPYLSYVNLNGVKKEGPKIMDIGKGDYEFEMIKLLKEEGYHGPWGILGHIKTEDVKLVLERNIEGLKSLNTQFNKTL